MPTNRRRRSRRAVGSSSDALLALLRGDPPPEGTTLDEARRLLSNRLLFERAPQSVTRWWQEFGATVLAEWRGLGPPWGQLEAEAEAAGNCGCWRLEHPHVEAWERLARPDRHKANGA